MTTEDKPIDRKPKQLYVPRLKGETEDAAITKAVIRPEVLSAMTIHRWGDNQLAINTLVEALSGQVEAVNDGIMKQPEAMLTAQAHTLDALFNNLAMRAQSHRELLQFEACLRLAFKAQSQCRATLETLAAIKNPPVVFAKQANFAQGPQQINNGTHAGENKNHQNELLEQTHGERLDTRKKATASGINPAMATMEQVHRAEN
ncbi:MAG: hypothetical protein PHG00_16355 [Methylococcales bacterium]|nr:hypothetical protein [Methylococcales bacterium]